MMTFVLASLYYSTILAALAYTGYLLTNRWRPDVTHKLQLVAQERGLHAASWLVALAYRQVEGLECVEAVLGDGAGHEICVRILNPNIPETTGGSSGGITVGDFVRIVTPRDEAAENFSVRSARFVVSYGGQRYVMHFSQTQLNTLLGVVLDSARRISCEPTLDNQTLHGEPVRASLTFAGETHHSRVLDAVVSLVGPKGRWWHAEADVAAAAATPPLHHVTGQAVVREVMRAVYGLRCTDHFWRNIVAGEARVVIYFAGRRRGQPVTITQHTESFSPFNAA
jgi:hypothetical protein